jgi:hypothetical protein
VPEKKDQGSVERIFQSPWLILQVSFYFMLPFGVKNAGDLGDDAFLLFRGRVQEGPALFQVFLGQGFFGKIGIILEHHLITI